MKRTGFLVAVTLCSVFVIACTGGVGSEPSVLSASDVAKEFKASKTAAMSKYGRKEVTVRGYTYVSGKLGSNIDGSPRKTGMILLKDKDDENYNEVTCEFDAAGLADFQKITGKQYVTVKGTFANEDKPRLEPCKFVKVE